MILCKFVTWNSKDGIVPVDSFELPAVPAPGEELSIKGVSYKVYSRRWAITQEGELHCYLRMV